MRLAIWSLLPSAKCGFSVVGACQSRRRSVSLSRSVASAAEAHPARATSRTIPEKAVGNSRAAALERARKIVVLILSPLYARGLPQHGRKYSADVAPGDAVYNQDILRFLILARADHLGPRPVECHRSLG